MSLEIAGYTTYDDIRAALGVSADEIEDSTLSLSVYAYNLEAELRDLGSTLIADYTAVNDLPPDTRTDAQFWFFQMTRLFATYAVAKHLTASLPLFSPKEITDSKASMVRYATDPYEATIRDVKAQFTQNRNRLISAYSAVQVSARSSSATPTYSVVATPSYDPISGA